VLAIRDASINKIDDDSGQEVSHCSEGGCGFVALQAASNAHSARLTKAGRLVGVLHCVPLFQCLPGVKLPSQLTETPDCLVAKALAIRNARLDKLDYHSDQHPAGLA
jgi:hypothetical protein